METLAPPVVAVVVAHDPGPWFEEALASLASQDYPELSVLVLDSASAHDLTSRVASVLPTAYVRRFDRNRGFGATADEVRTMVDGAAYFLFCHDDVALFPDAVHLLVEEAFRSNAGIVAPKVVSWDDPDRLVHVGMVVDKGGSVVDRVQPHEIDHGQHDAVRDVFVAPGGCTLVRCDLFEELGGFDPGIAAMGEDLDLCWRAQVAGARIIVAPDARVRHREELAAGSRPLDPSLEGVVDGDAEHPVTLQELQRRHELLAVLKCYGWFHLARVVPQIFVLAVGEVIVAELAGNRARARAVIRAWRWNIAGLGALHGRRKEVQSRRRLSDKEIRVLQLAGSARLSAYVRRVFQHGFHGAHADEMEAAADQEVGGSDGGGGGALPSAGEPPPAAEDVARGRLSGRVRLVSWLVAILVLVIGTRGLLGAPIPSLGQFVPFPSWGSTFAQFATGWHPSGVGSTAPASPAFALAGVVGTVLLGAMGLTQKVLIFGCVPLGAWGVVRLLRPFGSQRASLVAGVVYLAIPLPYDALALGRWGALIVYAGAPWVLLILFRATGLAPFADDRDLTASTASTAIVPGRRSGRSGRSGASAGPARRAGGGTSRRILLLGLLEAILVSFVPAAAIVVVLAGAAVMVSSTVLGGWRSAGKAFGVALGATVVAGVLCLPWVIGAVTAGRGMVAVFGVATPVSEAASWGTLLRFAVGPIGSSPLAWGFGVAALLPLILGRGSRFQWAGRCWSIALACWLLAWLVGRGWTGSLAIDPLVLLAPAAVAVAAAIGLGIAAFEEDLRAATFGWKQLVTVVAAVVVVLGALPTLVSALPGRWDLPPNDFDQALAWMQGKTTAGAFRVLWLGDPRSLNQGSWSAGDGLAYATSVDGAPNATWLWNAADPGPTALLASAVTQARSGRTDQLGKMLAPAGVRYVVTVTALAPVIPGVQTPQEYPVPADLAPALGQQLDLQPMLSESGLTVYQNADWVPVRAAVASSTSHQAAGAGAGTGAGTSLPGSGLPEPLGTPPGTSILPGAVPVLPGSAASRSYQGPLSPGTVYSALAPAGRWVLNGPSGATAPRSTSFGWAGSYQVDRPGPATLRFEGGLWVPGAVVFQIVAWALAASLLIRRRNVSRSLTRARRRRARSSASVTDAAPRRPPRGSAGEAAAVAATGSSVTAEGGWTDGLDGADG